MEAERWLQVRDLFDQTAELDDDQQQAFLREKCGSDAALLQEVDALLQSDRQAGVFLSDLVTSSSEVAQEPDEDAGESRIGPYRLLRKLGDGGMASVYLAARADHSFRRQVVLKLIRRGMESAQTRQRLRTERQILATLDHPNIARLFDGGTIHDASLGDNLPYFVLEFVEGLPIDDFCDHHRLSVAERLRLFSKVCSAVHYAHQHLVVHRDLKPSNILVTAAGEPKLLDFGIAKLLSPDSAGGDAAPTVAWARWLTPDYASPEQILGCPVTTASDVYSLGVLLHQLLLGTLPRRFTGCSPAEIEASLENSSLERPSDRWLRPSVTSAAASDSSKPGSTARSWDPATISAARGVRPQRLHKQLAGDLDTILLKALHRDPERRYPSAEQLSLDLHRHLSGFPVLARPDSPIYRWRKFIRRHRLGVAVASAFLTLLVTATLVLAVQSAKIAQERDQLKAVLSFIQETFKVAGEGEELTVRQAVDRSATILERQMQDWPEVRALLMDTTGTIYLNLWALDAAVAQLTQAVEVRSEIFGPDSVEVAESLSSLGLAKAYRGDFEAGEMTAREALSYYRRQVDSEAPELVRPLNHLVSVLCFRSDFAAAEAPSIEAFNLARQELTESSEEYATAIGNRALLLTKEGRSAEAAVLYQEVLELHRRYRGEEHPEVVTVLNNLALVLKREQQMVAAADLYRQALALERKLFGQDHSRVAVTLNNLGALQLASGESVAAAATYLEARTLAHETLGADHPGALITSVGLASARIASGEASSAETLLLEGLPAWRARLGDSWLIAYAESVLGESLAAQQRFEAAEELLTRSYPKIRQAQGEESPKARNALNRLAVLYEAWGKPERFDAYRADFVR